MWSCWYVIITRLLLVELVVDRGQVDDWHAMKAALLTKYVVCRVCLKTQAGSLTVRKTEVVPHWMKPPPVNIILLFYEHFYLKRK